MKRILVAEPQDFSDEARRILETIGEVELRRPERLDFDAYDAIWIQLGFRPAPEGPSRCKVLACPATGLDHINLDACARAGIRVVSLKGETEFLKNVRATAELTVGLMLALMRRIVPAAADVRAGEWRRDLFRGTELHEKTVGLVGVGRLGSIVAGYLHAFGTTVLGSDPRPDFLPRVTRVPLDELLERSDVVSLHVAYDPSTRHLIGARELARMKRTAVLINTSRGGVIDERALLAALEEKRIAGAALDVLDGEPAVADHPLVAYARTHEELLIVPHIGGNTAESFVKTQTFLARRVVEALA